MSATTRRGFLRTAAVGTLGAAGLGRETPAQEPGARPPKADGLTVVNPRGRVPVSLIVDDSTCLVNLARFAIPQFAEVFPDRFRQPWATLPREIPDAFVRRFGEWCREQGVKGKYSLVPYPACVGWLDRDLPGWPRKDLDASLDLVRTLMTPNWDIHPEMITHTWVIDTRTGRPYPERSERFMENWRWTDGRSADEIADYLAYALRVLKNAGLNCQGVTTPGGFGNRALPSLSLAALEAVRDVFSAEIPHYFRHLFTDDRSVAPRVENASGLDGPDPRCVVSIVGCTGDWFGDWDGLTAGSPDQFVTEDGKGGRLPEVIARGEPAIMVGHWPGFYFNGLETGFQIFRTVVERLHANFDHLAWMTLSEIARYWAAKELTRVEPDGEGFAFRAPFACPTFTFRVNDRATGEPSWTPGGKPAAPLQRVERPSRLAAGTYARVGRDLLVCVDLPKGPSTLAVRASR